MYACQLHGILLIFISLWRLLFQLFAWNAPCGFWGCKNRPVSFPGRMSQKVTKPCLSVVYLSMFFIVLLIIRAHFYVFLVLIGMCSVFRLF